MTEAKLPPETASGSCDVPIEDLPLHQLENKSACKEYTQKRRRVQDPPHLINVSSLASQLSCDSVLDLRD